MAVITHAFARLEADYTALTADVQERFDRLMEQADTAGPHDYAPRMEQIADLVGLPNGEIRKCACSCWCPVIFDADHQDAHVIEESKGFNLGRVQCPTCTDRHRETASPGTTETDPTWTSAAPAPASTPCSPLRTTHPRTNWTVASTP